ncbi:MAG: DUF362 domain-containing protein [Prevotella sp.]|nr:DUF362 domain-containing protein [Prevotella sp.]
MKTRILLAALLSVLVATKTFAQTNVTRSQSTVYMTRDISPEALVKIYEALGVEAHGRVAVKISTGEAGGENYLKPELIAKLVDRVGGTIVECNTAYQGSRNTSEAHWQTIREHGFDAIAAVDLMDEQGSVRIPVKDKKHIKYDIVGSHLPNYTFMVNLAHFKGHAMGGFGGVLKNASIGVASAEGKAYIHSAGATQDPEQLWDNFIAEQDDFLEAMAAAAQAVHNYFGEGNILYINVMNSMSVDCDCDSHPAEPQMKDIGILASTDPVALDKACLDLVFNHVASQNDDNTPLIERINRQHGTYIVDYAEKIGLGTKSYKLISIDND